MIHTVWPSESAQQVASICQASFGRGHSKRRQATWGRLCGCGATMPRRTSTRWIVATDGTSSAAACQVVGDRSAPRSRTRSSLRSRMIASSVSAEIAAATSAAAAIAPPARRGLRPRTAAGTCRASGGRSRARGTTPSPSPAPHWRTPPAASLPSTPPSAPCPTDHRAPTRCQRCPATETVSDQKRDNSCQGERGVAEVGCDSLSWPQEDGLRWPHLGGGRVLL